MGARPDRRGVLNSRQKGKRVERLWRDQLREAGFLKAYRGQQYCGSAGDADVVCPELPSIHWEVKGVQNLNVLNAVKQAVSDSAKSGRTPVVAHKKNGEPWLVTMLADDWLDLVKETDRVVTETREDYLRYLKTIGFTPGQADAWMAETAYDPSREREDLTAKPSAIHGVGVFAETDLPEGRSWLAAESPVTFLVGRYINHSPEPNCAFYEDGSGRVFCKTLRALRAGEELTCDYKENLKLPSLDLSRREVYPGNGPREGGGRLRT